MGSDPVPVATDLLVLLTMLSPAECARFVAEGFLRIDSAFSPAAAADVRATLWNDLRAQGISEHDPRTWTHPVVRLGMYPQAHMVAVANTPRLHAAFDQLVGPGVWRPCRALGTVPVRFPLPQEPGDCGWHIDAGFGADATDFMAWRANIHSRGRTLLMLMLLSDTTAQDAPTRIRVGSHLDIARVLAPAGAAGLSLRDLLPHFTQPPVRDEVLATGPAGSVYLCHPFLVHAAQIHLGSVPRFLAQPPLLPVDEQWLPKGPGAGYPVARAIAAALAGAA